MSVPVVILRLNHPELFILYLWKLLYNFENLLIACLGDIIRSDIKHYFVNIGMLSKLSFVLFYFFGVLTIHYFKLNNNLVVNNTFQEPKNLTS